MSKLRNVVLSELRIMFIICKRQNAPDFSELPQFVQTAQKSPCLGNIEF